jgi:cysteine desulfuration protein SufE
MAQHTIEQIIDLFQSVEPSMRLELLLDYAKKLPALPERLKALRDRGVSRVPECQTPVFLFIEAEAGAVRIHADVAEESPTVRGFVSILIDAYDDEAPSVVATAPPDLLHRLGLGELLRMTREVGLSAIVTRLKREASKATAQPVAAAQRT